MWHDLKLQHSSSVNEPFRLNVVCPLRILPSRILSQCSYILVVVSELWPQRPTVADITLCWYFISLQAELVSSVEKLIPKKILPRSVQHWFTVKSERTVTLNHKFRNVLEVLRSMMWGDIRYASADIFGISQLTSVSLSARFYPVLHGHVLMQVPDQIYIVAVLAG